MFALLAEPEHHPPSPSRPPNPFIIETSKAKSFS